MFDARVEKDRVQKFCSNSCKVRDQHKRGVIGLEYNNPNYIDGRSTKTYFCSCGGEMSDYRSTMCKFCWVRKLRAQKAPFFEPFIRDEEWNKNRSLALERDNYCCVSCGDHEDTVVHHIILKEIAGHSLENLETLCRGCHSHLHAVTRV